MGRRILFVLNEASFFISHRLPVANAARDAGWEVHVAAPADHVWAPPGFTVDSIRALGFAFHEIPLSRRGKNPIQEIRTFAALLRLYGCLRPDLVHHLTIKPNLYGGIAARLCRIPAVFAVPGLGQVFVARGARASILRAVISGLLRIAFAHPRSRVILQNSDDFEQLTAGRIVPRERAVLIRGSGANLAKFQCRPLPVGVPMIVLASRLIWDKGIAEFVEAARVLRGRGVAARCVLVGDTQSSNPRAVPRSTLEAWVAEGVIEWWGFRDDMADVITQATVCCLPSTYGEGVPKVLLEAAAGGRAIVATDIPGCREIVKDGVNGYLVPRKDVARLAARLEELVTDRAKAATFGLAGRALAEREFDETSVAARTVEVYATLRNG